MDRSEPLPERLQYLQPYREFLTKLKKTEVGDGTDTTLLEKLIYEQIKGKTVEAAKEKLAGDLEELEKHLSDPKRRDDRLHFVIGFLLIAAEDPEELLKPPEKPAVIAEWVLMNLPPRARSKFSKESSALHVKWKGQSFYAHRCSMEDDFSRKKVLVEFEHSNVSEYERFLLRGQPALAEMVPPVAREIRRQSVGVNLGEVTGHKYISSGESPATWKRVDYLLKIPECYISISIQAHELFDESEWDPYLATLRFGKPPVK
ncbi:MAG TPA: hypothetical protein VK742_09935 [Candidatus Sulfotelmatobacter sp.]|jgi:hypothetical protein|nr:hypothetical protein [Candidatus Sulfotelmatobacter sp.]